MPATDLETENQIFQRMAMQGQTMIAASGDSGSEDCFPAQPRRHPAFDTELAVDDPGSQPDVISAGGTTLPARRRPRQTVWNDCQKHCLEPAPERSSGGQLVNGCHRRRLLRPVAHGPPTNPPPPAAAQPGGARPRRTRPIPSERRGRGLLGRGLARLRRHQRRPRRPTPGSSPTPTRAASPRSAWSARTLYANGGPGNSNFTDITTGNNDFTDTNGGDYAGHRPATTRPPASAPRSTRTSPSPSRAPTAARRCRRSAPNTGPGQRRRRHHDHRRRLRQRHVRHVRLGRHRPDRLPVRDLHHRHPARTPGPLCVDVTVANSQGISATPPPTTTASAATSTAARATASSPPTAASSTSATPASGAAPAASR